MDHHLHLVTGYGCILFEGKRNHSLVCYENLHQLNVRSSELKRFFIFVNDTSKLTAIKLWKLFCLIHIYHSSIGRPDWGLDSDIICFSLMSSHPTCYIPEILTRLIECKFIYIVGLQLNAIVNHITSFHVDSIIVYTLEHFTLRHRWWVFFSFCTRNLHR